MSEPVWITPVICDAWEYRASRRRGRWYGDSCCYCRRDIAAPEAKGLFCCPYCALDRGLVPAIDVPLT
jgi:hypothetical protein